MPYIQCEIHTGLEESKKAELARELAQAVHEALGSPIPYIHVAVREIPGGQFVEAGQLNASYAEVGGITEAAPLLVGAGAR